jgi:hypothetical protein
METPAGPPPSQALYERRDFFQEQVTRERNAYLAARAVEDLLDRLGLSRQAIDALAAEDRQNYFFKTMSALTFERLSKHLENTRRVASLATPTSMDAIEALFDSQACRLIFPELKTSPTPVKLILQIAFNQAGLDPDEAQAKSLLILQSLASVTTSPTVTTSGTQSQGRSMFEDDRILTKQGSRYIPVVLAAELAQVPRTTLLNWIKAKVKFQGRTLQIYKSETAKKSYLTEESVQRLANRFVKWPSNKPAGSVTIGKTDDQSGYIPISSAARTLGVDHHTMWYWTAQSKAPTAAPLDVIKCSGSEQLYIHEKAVSELRKFVPRSGLRRGRRTGQAAQPA